MNILSIETATDWCGIALFINGDCKQKIQKKYLKNILNNYPFITMNFFLIRVSMTMN